MVTYLTSATTKARCAEDVTGGGHIARMCKGKPHQQEANPPREQVEHVGTDADSADSDNDPLSFCVNAIIKESLTRIMLEPIVAGVWLPMK